MTALIIIAAVLAFIIILLYFPVTAEVSFLNKKFTLRVKYLIFTIFPVPAAKKPPGRKKKRKGKKAVSHTDEAGEAPEAAGGEDTAAAEEDEKEEDDTTLAGEKPAKKTFSDRLDAVKEKKRQITLIWQLCKKNLYGIIKNIAADRVTIDLTAAGEDAYSAARLYGELNAAVWNAVAVSSGYMKVKYDKVSIKADFNSEEPLFNISARIKITPAVVAGNVIAAAFKLLVNLKKIRTPKGMAVKS